MTEHRENAAMMTRLTELEAMRVRLLLTADRLEREGSISEAAIIRKAIGD